MIVLSASNATTLVALEPMVPDAAERLGDALAAIDPWARYGFTPTALTAYLADDEPGAPRYVICVNGQIAGAVGLRTSWLRGPYLQFLGIVPAYQGDGIGGSVLQWFEDNARAAGARNLWVAVSAFNSGAMRFYQQHGFQPAAELDNLLQDGISESLLRKNLCDKK